VWGEGGEAWKKERVNLGKKWFEKKKNGVCEFFVKRVVRLKKNVAMATFLGQKVSKGRTTE